MAPTTEPEAETPGPVTPERQPRAHLTNVLPRPAAGVPLTGAANQYQTRNSEDLKPTTSVLTATTLTYAIRAGITAGAGTRLVL